MTHIFEIRIPREYAKRQDADVRLDDMRKMNAPYTGAVFRTLYTPEYIVPHKVAKEAP